jgi:hypothetical protein
MSFDSINRAFVSHTFEAILGGAFATLIGFGALALLEFLFPSLTENVRRVIAFAIFLSMYGCIYLVYRYGKIQRIESDLQNANLLNIELSRIWDFLSATCGLTETAEKLAGSKFRPSELLSTLNLKHLDVLGNGCSKWTDVDRNILSRAIEQIGSRDGQARFLIQCPIALNAKGKTVKAKKNAQSLQLLRNLIDDSKRRSGNNSTPSKKYIEVKVYTHKPVFRLTILNQTDKVVVGHYGGGEQDSNDTPLLVFSNIQSARWSFHQAFVDYFKLQWDAAPIIDDSKWKAINKIAESRQVASKTIRGRVSV